MSEYKTFKQVLSEIESQPTEWADFEEVAKEFQIYDWPEGDDWVDRMHKKTFDRWICWDTLVGRHVLFIDNEPVAVGLQEARKSDVEYLWVSAEAFDKARQFVLKYVQNRVSPPKQFVGPDTRIPIEGDEIGDSRSAHGYMKGREK